VIIRDVIDRFRLFLENSTNRPSQNSVIPNRFLYHQLVQAKVHVIEKYNFNGFNVDKGVIGSLPCIMLEEVDKVDSKVAPASGCYWMKTIEPVPDMMFDLPITVSDMAGNVYDYITWTNFPHKKKSRVKAERQGNYYTIRVEGGDNHCYVYNSSGLKAVSSDLVPVDSLDVWYYPDCGEELPFCDPLDKDFLVSEEHLTEIFEVAYRIIQVSKSLSGGPDVRNNSNDDSAANVSKSK